MTPAAGAIGGKLDVTPDAVDWANISFASPGGSSNANQTIAGVDVAILLQITWTNTGLTLTYDINDGAGVGLTSGDSFAISSGQTLSFTATRAGPGSNVVTITNLSDSSTILDTFTVTAT